MISSHVATAFVSALAYSSIAFGAGFVLGVIRTLLIVPRLGELFGVFLETLIILPICWIAAKWSVSKYNVSPQWSIRFLMGAAAFLFLMEWEVAMSVVLFGKTLQEAVRDVVLPSTLPRILGYCGQILYGIFPVMVGVAETNETQSSQRTKEKAG